MQMLALSAGRGGQHIVADEFFSYSTPRTAVAQGASATVNITIESNSDFLIEKTTFSADIAAAAQTANTKVLPNVQVQLNATGSGRNLLNIQTNLQNLFGSGTIPFILPRAYLLPAASTLQITFTSFEAANDNNITLSFIGRKLFWANMPPVMQRPSAPAR